LMRRQVPGKSSEQSREYNELLSKRMQEFEVKMQEEMQSWQRLSNLAGGDKNEAVFLHNCQTRIGVVEAQLASVESQLQASRAATSTGSHINDLFVELKEVAHTVMKHEEALGHLCSACSSGDFTHKDSLKGRLQDLNTDAGQMNGQLKSGLVKRVLRLEEHLDRQLATLEAELSSSAQRLLQSSMSDIQRQFGNLEKQMTLLCEDLPCKSLSRLQQQFIDEAIEASHVPFNKDFGSIRDLCKSTQEVVSAIAEELVCLKDIIRTLRADHEERSGLPSENIESVQREIQDLHALLSTEIKGIRDEHHHNQVLATNVLAELSGLQQSMDAIKESHCIAIHSLQKVGHAPEELHVSQGGW